MAVHNSPTSDQTVLVIVDQELREADTVLDLGCGACGLHAAARGARAIVNSLDEGRLEEGLRQADKKPNWKIAFMVKDAMGVTSQVPQADIVLALNWVYPERGLDFIAKRFSALTRR